MPEPSPPTKYSHERVAPVFVGGTGRSGTTVVGRLIGQHSAYAMIPIEARFHAEPLGLPGLLSGRLTVNEFKGQMLGPWFANDHPRSGLERGLYTIIERKDLESSLEAFEERHLKDPIDASRRLIHDILDPVAEREGKPGWVEMTPINIAHAPTLHSLLPEARFVHTVRDGRDTACSLVSLGWIPTIEEAIEWWGPRVRRALAASRKVPLPQLLYVRLEDLVADDRERTFKKLLRFLQIGLEPGLEAFFENELSADRAHVGRWQRDVEGEQRERLSNRYEEILSTLELPKALQPRVKKPARAAPAASGPSFVILGSEPAAVRWAVDTLRAHPDVDLPRRGPATFIDLVAQGSAEYARFFDGARENAFLGHVAPESIARADQAEECARALQAVLPETKLLAFIRDPVDSLAAVWAQHRADAPEREAGSVLDYVLGTRIEDDPLRLVAACRFGAALKPMAERFGDRLLVITWEELAIDPEAVFQRTADHIGLPVPEGFEVSAPVEESPTLTLTLGERATIFHTFFRDDVEELEQATERDLPGWRPFLAAAA